MELAALIAGAVGAVLDAIVLVTVAAAMAAWCSLAIFSVGPLMLPCLLLMVIAAVRSFV